MLFASVTMAFAQAGRGGLSGLVSDATGAVIPGITVELQSTGTGVTVSTVTTSAGLYSFVSLTPATYQLKISYPGFKTVIEKNVIVTVDQVTTLNLTLQPGTVNQVVTVTAAPELAETSNSTVGQLITAPMIDRVPLITRDVYELVQLSAGVNPTNGTPNAADTSAVYNARPGADVSAYTVNGALQGSVYYLLDGSPIGIAENNLAAIIPAFQVPLDDVQEYRVETQNVPATYQSGGAGVISLVTKSGTNEFHGDAFAYIRPDKFAANDTFVKASQLAAGEPNQPVAFHRYQEGGSIGGPILHNKLFFFGDYEVTQQQSLQTGTYTVPTIAERTGDFSGDTFTVYNPLVPDLPNGQRQPFAGNIIPTGDLNSIALKYAQQFPLPNQAGVGEYHVNNYFATGLNPNDAQKFDIRMDYYLSEKQHIFGRFSFDRLKFGNSDLYGSSNIYDYNYYQNITNGRNILLADDVTFSPTTILQLRYSFTRHYENQTGDPRQIGFDMTSLGFPSSLASQQVYKDIPLITFGGATADLGAPDYTTFHFASMTHDAIASLTTVKGKHDLGIGFEFQKQFMNEGQPISPSGWYQFDNTATSSTTFAGDGYDFASFMLGMGSAPGYEYYNFTHDIFGAESNPYYAAYVQDSYHLSSKLTLNLGLRWDIFGGRTERYNRLEYFDPNVQYSVSGMPLVGGEQFVKNGGSSFTTNLRNFGPRVGVAYQPFNRLVIRGGFGIYYGPSTQMVANSALNSDGFFAVTSWNATAYNADGNSVPVNLLSNPFPSGLVQPTGSSLGPATSIGSTLLTALRSQRTPTTYDFNFGIQYELPHESIISAAWVGSRGLFLPLGGVDLNQLSLGTIAQYQSALVTPIPNKWASIWPTTSPFYGQTTVPQYLALEPYPQFNCGAMNCGVEAFGYGGGDSIYHSLQLKFQKRLAKHFTTLAAFTWGKLLTDDSGSPLSFIGYHAQTVQDWRNLNLERSISSQDLSYVFSWQTSYDLPIGRDRFLNLNRWGNRIFGGWTLNSIVFFSSGTPIASPSGTGDPYFSQRTDIACNPGKNAPHTAAQWFSYTCFSEPTSQFSPGTAPAYLSDVRTDGGHNWDASIFKIIPLTERAKLQLEFAAYNVTNSVQYGYPSVFWNPNPTPANMGGFGQVTSAANTPRQLQFAARFFF
ncbi:MAG: carboxypeptidase regulatory-like domain-containing protein [Candidatus Acidiferrum sp.]